MTLRVSINGNYEINMSNWTFMEFFAPRNQTNNNTFIADKQPYMNVCVTVV